jgi:olfactory receptor
LCCPTIMRQQVCHFFIVLAWIRSVIHVITHITLLFRFCFCGPNLIDYYSCELQPSLTFLCMDTYVVNLLLVANSGTLCSCGFILFMISYIVILPSLRNYGEEGRTKALSTCTFHIIIVVLFYSSYIFIFTRPTTTLPLDKMVTIFHAIGTPFLVLSV